MSCQNLLKCQNNDANSSVAKILLFSTALFLCLLDRKIKIMFLDFEKGQISTENKAILSRAEFN